MDCIHNTCETDVQKSLYFVPGYALCPVILEQNENYHESQRGNQNHRYRTRHSANVRRSSDRSYHPAENQSPSSIRRWKCPTCRYNKNAHLFEEEPAAGIASADQSADLGYRNKGFREKVAFSKMKGSRQESYNSRQERGKNIYFNKDEKENFLATECPYTLRICLGNPMPENKLRDQKKGPKFTHLKKYKKKASMGPFSQQKENSCFRIFINFAQDSCVKGDSIDFSDYQKTKDQSTHLAVKPELIKVTPKIVAFIPGLQLFPD